MKKYFILIISFILILGISCKKKEEENKTNKEDFKIIEFTGEHINSLNNDNLLSYIIYRAKPSDEGLLQSLSFYSHILKNNVTNRENVYYQVDYKFSNNVKETYYHIFDYKDRYERQYIQNYYPYNKSNQGFIDNVSVLFQYSFDTNGNKINKEIKYSEDIIKFIDKENNINNDFDLEFTKIEELKYKLFFNFDCEKYNNGHFDLQTFLMFGDEVIPFYGLYNYGVEALNYQTVSSEEFDNGYKPIRIYWIINYYNQDGNKEEFYYKEDIVE